MIIWVGTSEEMGTHQLCRIVVGILSQIGRDSHRDMGDLSTRKNYSKPPRFDETSRFESLRDNVVYWKIKRKIKDDLQ